MVMMRSYRPELALARECGKQPSGQLPDNGDSLHRSTGNGKCSGGLVYPRYVGGFCRDLKSTTPRALIKPSGGRQFDQGAGWVSRDQKEWERGVHALLPVSLNLYLI